MQPKHGNAGHALPESEALFYRPFDTNPSCEHAGAVYLSKTGHDRQGSPASTVQLSAAHVSAVLHLELGVKTRLAAGGEYASPRIF
jgi:hypothetical protein